MSVGAFGSGLAKAFADYVSGERTRARQSEDNQLDEQMQLIKALADRPDINPALLGRALTDLTALQQAKGSKRKSKGGKEGFLGATELPLSQFLQGLQDGTTPMIGRTSEAIPAPPVPTDVAGYGPAQMIPNKARDINVDLGNGTGFSAGFDGAEVLAQPIPVPPAGMPMPSPGHGERLASAARDVQAHTALGVKPRRPVKQQPLLRAPEEMAEERGRMEGATYGGRMEGQLEAKAEILRKLGVPEARIQQAMLREIEGAAPRPVPLQTQNYVDADGKPFTVMFDPATGAYMDPSGTQMALPPGSRRVGIGPIVRYNFQTDDYGNVTYSAMDANTPGMLASGTLPTQGRTSPAGPVVAFVNDQGGNQIGRTDRTGTTVTPLNLGGAPVLQPAQAAEQTAATANMTALQALQRMESMYVPEYVGPAAGRYNTASQLVPDVPGVNIMPSAPPGFADFQSVVTHFSNAMIKAITGAQMSEPEAVRIKQELPQVIDQPEVFKARLQQSKINIGDVVRAYVARGRPVPQELLDAAKAFGIALPAVTQPPPVNTGADLPPPPAVPGRGVKLRAPNGTTKEYVDPVMIEYLKGKGAVVVR